MDGAMQAAVIYDRAKLRAGDTIPGPAIVIEMDSTTLIETGCVGDGRRVRQHPDQSGLRRNAMPATIIKPTTTPFNASRDRSGHARHHRKRAAQRAHRNGRHAGAHRHVARHPRTGRCLSADRRSHDGKMIVGQFGSFIGGFLDGYDGTLEDGDMIFLSDPYSRRRRDQPLERLAGAAAGVQGRRLIAYTSMFGHQSDIGGKVAGSMPIDARSIFEEGVRIPPVKIWKQGRI
jgi:hypothetical protein